MRHLAGSGSARLCGTVKSGRKIARRLFALQGNQLLSYLTESTVSRLSAHFRRIEPSFGTVLLEQDTHCEFGYFPLRGGVISMTRQVEEGQMIEVGVIGYEGFGGVSTLLDPRHQLDRGIVQGEGVFLEVPIAFLREEVGRNAELREIVFRYTSAFLMQVAQTALCNRLHNVQQRFARWILMMHDRVVGDDLRITQEFLAHMLGVRTAGVNEAIRDAEAAGLVRHSRQRLTVLDRTGLEAQACECYAAVKAHFERIGQ
jgi:CRP-like cAMP-binding protein